MNLVEVLKKKKKPWEEKQIAECRRPPSKLFLHSVSYTYYGMYTIKGGTLGYVS